ILRGVDIELHRGRVTALVGPNASGKTTFIKCILGLVQHDAGTVVFDGKEIQRNDVLYRARVGYMPQVAQFPENLTGSEVLTLLSDLRSASDRDLDESLVDLFDLRKELDKPLHTLSGGTRQKLNAAIAFLFRPDVVVLDEPTAGLDPIASTVLRDKIEDAKAEGLAGLLTSHIVSELEALADDIVFLTEGVVRFAGSVDELRSRYGHQRLDRAITSLMTTRA
ncbi:MAG: ABC transporter ATP-binding protein, partial [Rubricoccaceae bacterium]|nr:ABC transporter ATP-binding protein [Rubricoccaceae bacterium]